MIDKILQVIISALRRRGAYIKCSPVISSCDRMKARMKARRIWARRGHLHYFVCRVTVYPDMVTIGTTSKETVVLVANPTLFADVVKAYKKYKKQALERHLRNIDRDVDVYQRVEKFLDDYCPDAEPGQDLSATAVTLYLDSFRMSFDTWVRQVRKTGRIFPYLEASDKEINERS